MKLTIFTTLPSANELLRMHWAKRSRLRKLLVKEIEVACWEVRVEVPVEREKVKKSVTITIFRKGRRFDKDNAYGAAKPVVDALRSLGLIYNDSERWLDLGVCQELDHAHPRTEIEIKSVGFTAVRRTTEKWDSKKLPCPAREGD